MSGDNKRRSGSFGSQKAMSSDEGKKLSLSEGSMDKESSPVSNISHGSSDSGTVKKPRKFKPGKFIAKRFKRKKSEKSSDDQEGNTAESGQSEQEMSRKSSIGAKISEKLRSPKLQRFNIVKRFSGTRSYKVSPGSLDGGINEAPSNLRNLAGLSASESSVKKPAATTEIDDSKSEPPTEILSFDEAEFEGASSAVASYQPVSKETVIMESKKVQLKITISGKKVEKRGSPSTSAVDMASPPTQLPTEPSHKRSDIILPSSSTEVRLSTSRDVMVPRVRQPTKPISAAKELDDANSVKVAEVTKFQELRELQIHEEDSEVEAEVKDLPQVERIAELLEAIAVPLEAGEEPLRACEEQLEAREEQLEAREGRLEAREEPLKSIEEQLEATEEPLTRQNVELVEAPQKSEPEAPENAPRKDSIGPELSGALASSTPLKSKSDESDEESQEMKKHGKKSKIPVSRKHSSDMDSLPTVHTQEAHKPRTVNITSSSEDLRKSPSSELKAEEIKFVIGTPVRHQRTSAASLSLRPENPTIDITHDDSIDDSFHSGRSERSISTRRRIQYVPQLSIYTPEEQEQLKSNIHANASDSFDMSSLPDSSMFPMFDIPGDAMSSTPEKREHLYKILVIGELGTGKTSFIKRYVHQFFSQNYRATIGVDFALKVLNWDQQTIIRLQLWDIAGQERFGNMTRVYYKEAVGAFIVFDVTRSATFDAVLKWKHDLDSKVQLPDGSPIPCILLANKCDQQKQGLVTMPAKMDEYCKQHGFSGWFETSAKDNVNVEESAKALVSKILINDKLIHNDGIDGDRLVLNAEDGSSQKKSFCSC